MLVVGRCVLMQHKMLSTVVTVADRLLDKHLNGIRNNGQ